MLRVNQLNGFGVIERRVPSTIERLGHVNSTANNITYTFGGQSLGEAAADRYIIVAVAFRDDGLSADATAVSVAGVAATEFGNVSFANSSESCYTGFWIVALPSGTTGDIVITGNTTMTEVAATWYRVTGLASATPTDTSTDTAGTGVNVMDMNLDVQAGGIVLAIATSDVEGIACTWTGIVDEDDDVGLGNMRATAASRKQTAAGAAQAIQVTMGTGNLRACSSAAHWAAINGF